MRGRVEGRRIDGRGKRESTGATQRSKGKEGERERDTAKNNTTERKRKKTTEMKHVTECLCASGREIQKRNYISIDSSNQKRQTCVEEVEKHKAESGKLEEGTNQKKQQKARCTRGEHWR